MLSNNAAGISVKWLLTDNTDHCFKPVSLTKGQAIDLCLQKETECTLEDLYHSLLRGWPLTETAQTVRLVKPNTGFDKVNIDIC